MKEEELWPLDVRKLPREGDWLDLAFSAQMKEEETQKNTTIFNQICSLLQKHMIMISS